MKTKILKNLNTKEEKKYKKWLWAHEILDACLHYAFGVTEIMTRKLGKYIPGMTIIAVYFKKYKIYYCHPNFELERVVKGVMGNFHKDPNYVKNLYKKWKKKIRFFYEIYQEVKDKDLKKLNNQELINFYFKFYNSLLEGAPPAFIIEAFTVGHYKPIENDFRKFLEERGLAGQLGHYLGALTFPEKISFGKRAHLEFLEIIKLIPARIKKNIIKEPRQKISPFLRKYPRLLDKINKFIYNYSWLRNNYAHAKPIDLDYVINELKFILKNRPESKIDVEKTKKGKEKLINKLKLPQDLINQARLASLLTSWHDERKEMCLRVQEICSKFLDEISRRTKTRKEYLKFSTPYELKEILSGKFDLRELQKRSKECLAIWDENQFKIITGIKAGEIFKKIFISRVSKTEEITGIPASPGKVKGKAKIILSSKQVSNFKKGDILVAGMTRPDYIGIIRKAGAIVTDEGGITCHAAIVSRELGIPCVIGTKIATEALKDGDLVEIDAEKGVVRKVNK